MTAVMTTTNLNEQEFMNFKEKYPELKSHPNASFYFAAFLGDKKPFKHAKKEGLWKDKHLNSQNKFYIDICEFATKGGNLSFIEWLFKSFHEQLKQNDMAHKMIYFIAAEMNRQDIIRSINNLGYCEFKQFNECIHHATKGGHLELTKWLMENGCIWDEDVCTIAAGHGYLEIIQWAIIKNLIWNPDICFRAAAINGHLEILKWAKTNGYTFKPSIFKFAAESGQLEILKWFWENDEKLFDCRFCLNIIVASDVARQGHLEVFKWLREKNCPWDSNICSFAAMHGHLHIIQWARENGCDWDEETS